MINPARFFGLLLVFLGVSIWPAVAGQAGHKSRPSPSRMFLNLLGQPKPAVAKVLGKPVRSGTFDESGDDWSVYRLPGTSGLRVTYAARGGGLPKITPTGYAVSFPAHTTWQSAVRAIGLNPNRLSASALSNIPEMLEIRGGLPTQWNLSFSPDNARYPGGKLINEDGGRPLLTAEQKSINE